MRINQNIAALNAYRNLSVNEGQRSKSLERLSSGFRINRAADDAAGLAISEKLRSQVRGLNQAVENAQNGVSLIQTGEGALGESHAILQRMRELAVRSANDSNTNSDRSQLQKEVDALVTELDRIANNTQFNTKNLLDGSFASTALSFQIGANANQTINVNIADMTTSGLGVGSVSVATSSGAQSAITTIDTAIGTVSGQRAKLGAAQNRLEHTVNNLSVAAENLAASESRIRDTDMAKEMVALTRSQILAQAGTAMLAQANQVPLGALALLQ